MNTFGSRLRAVRKERGFKTQTALAKQIGGKTSHVSISDWENDNYSPSDENAIMIAKILNVRYEWLKTGKGQKEVNKRDVDLSLTLSYINTYPVINWTEVSTWSSKMELTNKGDKVFKSSYISSGKCFALVVESESMAPIFNPKDTILIDTDMSPGDGKYALILVDEDTAIIRKISKEGKSIFLKAENPDWPDRLIRLTDNMSIIGQIVESKRSHL